MTTGENRGGVARTFGRGHFPHQLSWLIDNPLRRLLITPQRLADRLPLTESSRLLEIGPGSGFFSAELARRVHHGRLELLDLQPEMLAKARRYLEGRGFRNIGYSRADASVNIPFPDQYFDVALMVAVLGEVSDQKACLEHVFRTLRPGGVLAVHEHVPDPDRITFPALRSLAESQRYRFGKHWGPRCNYTALFERP